MSDQLQRSEFEDLIERAQWDALRSALKPLHPSDMAEILAGFAGERALPLREILPLEVTGQVFAYLPNQQQEALLASLNAPELRSLLDGMSPDDRTRVLEELPPATARHLLEVLSPVESQAARDLLDFPPESAGRYMTTQYAAIQADMTAQQALDHVRRTGRGKETVDVLYVVDRRGKLLQSISLGALVMMDPQAKVQETQEGTLLALSATTDREEVLRYFEKYDRMALPVTDDEGRLLGIITVDDVLDVAEEEATEDMQKMGGMEALDAAYLEVGYGEMVRKRGGWLSVLFLGEMLTATAMGLFEEEIAKAVVLALFVPLIISSGGNSGSQAATLVIRSLALNELRLRDWVRVLGRELRLSLTLGAWLGLIGFARIVLWHWLGWVDYTTHYVLVGVTIWLTLVGVVCFGSVAGSMLPFVLKRLGFDPATSSAPFVATLVDVTGLVIYFSIAAFILRGTLL